MLTKIALTKNCFTTGHFDPAQKKIVFVSYKRNPDRDSARKCAEILEETPGLDYWFDEDDECMAEAASQELRFKNGDLY